MIFDLLTLPQGHQFDPRVKILLALYSTHHPLLFDMPHDYVWKKIAFDPLGTPLRPQCPPPPPPPSPNSGARHREQNKKSCLICLISFICENTHKDWYKNLWNWLCNWNKMIFDLLTPPQGPRGRAQKKHQDKTPKNLAEENKTVVIFPVTTLLH